MIFQVCGLHTCQCLSLSMPLLSGLTVVLVDWHFQDNTPWINHYCWICVLFQIEEFLSVKRISIRHSPNGECRNRCKNNSCPRRELSLLSLVLRSLKTTCHGDWFQHSRFGSGWRLNSRNVIKSERCRKVAVDGIAVCADHFHPFLDERERWWRGHAKAWTSRWVPSWVRLPVGWVLALSSFVGSRR